MICKVCGSQIPDDAAECEFCGARTGGVDDATKVISADEIASAAAGAAAEEEIFDENEKKRREQMQKMMEDKQRQLSEIERRRNEKRARQKRNKILLIALICAGVVAAAGAGAYYVMKGTNPNNKIELTPAPTEAVAAAATATPAPTSDTLAMTTPAAGGAASAAPSDGSSAEANQSWTSTGNGGSASASNQSSQRVASNTGSSSAGGSSSSGGGSQASSGGGNSSGGSSSAGSSSSSSGSGSSTATNSGVVSDKISSALVTGGEVIYNTGTGRYLMTFTRNGTKYYANVSEGSTTEQIQGNMYTINADPTQETYNGNTVYEISDMTSYSGDYLLENSGTKLLTDSDISGMSKYDLALARNEIYARHGRKFQTKEYSDYFNSKSWYKINPNYNYSDDNANLNETEKKNVQFILNAEKR